ncbi:MAG: pteridine reductase [Gammaproteobacteria bacterium]|nr:pteridine reductase [Gammaproteobacteria bacterium]
MNQTNPSEHKVALITGSARRIGAEIARSLHRAGDNVILHYCNSASQALQLCEELNHQRAHSAVLLQADLTQIKTLDQLIEKAFNTWKRLDILVNNASVFYPTPISAIDEATWDQVMTTNLKAPFFLSRAAASLIKQQHGCIVNIDDIHAQRPLENHLVYSVSKSALRSLTQSLAKEFGPDVRVNGVAPGAILWPEQALSDQQKQDILTKTMLKRVGQPSDIAKTVNFLAHDADYITGQVISVDGGRTLYS